MPPPPALPTKKQFRKDTAHSNVLKRGRMRGSITVIDEALDQWHENRTADSSIVVYKACRGWLKAKVGKDSSNTGTRRGEITKLQNRALAWMAHLDPAKARMLERFNAKKRAGPQANLKPMSGAYGHERALYVNSGKTYAPSGTRLGNAYQAQHEQDVMYAREFTAFSDLTEQEYAELDRELGGDNPVTYMPKLRRLQHMAYVEGNRLRGFDEQLLTTDLNNGWPYAIDQYGNLFTMAFPDPAVEQFNHSSFNAGKDVVCAGVIWVDQGVLVAIDNNSGHYKPSQADLHRAVALLLQELGGGGTQGAVARVFVPVPAEYVIKVFEFPLAGLPAQGIPANMAPMHLQPIM